MGGLISVVIKLPSSGVFQDTLCIPPPLWHDTKVVVHGYSGKFIHILQLNHLEVSYAKLSIPLQMCITDNLLETEANKQMQ